MESEDIEEEYAEQESGEAAALKNINELLVLMRDQLQELRQAGDSLTESVHDIRQAGHELKEVTVGMPETIHHECVGEYKKIVENAAKNYLQMQKAVAVWQKKQVQGLKADLFWQQLSLKVTPILLLCILLRLLCS